MPVAMCTFCKGGWHTLTATLSRDINHYGQAKQHSASYWLPWRTDNTPGWSRIYGGCKLSDLQLTTHTPLTTIPYALSCYYTKLPHLTHTHSALNTTRRPSITFPQRGDTFSQANMINDQVNVFLSCPSNTVRYRTLHTTHLISHMTQEGNAYIPSYCGKHCTPLFNPLAGTDQV